MSDDHSAMGKGLVCGVRQSLASGWSSPSASLLPSVSPIREDHKSWHGALSLASVAVGDDMTPPPRLDSPDPAVREQAAREQIEYHRQRMAEMAAIRGKAVRDLKAKLHTWEAVGEAIGTTGQTAHKLAQRTGAA